MTQEQIDKAVDDGLKKLQGLWVRDKYEQNGSGPYWTPNYEAIYVEGKGFQTVTKSGEIPGGSEGVQFSIDPTKNPATIDFVWRGNKNVAIYKIEGNRLIIACKAADERPGQFSTHLTAGKERALVMITYKLAKPRVDDSKVVNDKKPAKEPVKLTQDQIDQLTETELKNMQGLWVMEKREENGRGPYWTPGYEAIYIEGSGFQSATKKGAIPGGSDGVKFTIDPTKSPATIDFVWRGDKNHAIYKLEGDRLTFACKAADDRPGKFSTQLSAGADRAIVMITYKLAIKPDDKKPAETAKQTPEQIDKAKADDLKRVQGLWILEKQEVNGREPYWTPRYEAMYIEGSILKQATKNGEIPRGSENVKFKLDPSRSPAAIDFTWRNDKYVGIYKIEGSRLIFACRLRDERPRQFTAELSAGAERTIIVLTYKLTKPKD